MKRRVFYIFWWNSKFDKLKELSIDAHTVWKQAGKLKCNPVYEAKRISNANYIYKLAVNRKKMQVKLHLLTICMSLC